MTTPRGDVAAGRNYSIDEAFCDLTGYEAADLTGDFGREIRATVLKRTHLTVGVGIALSKTLPLANHAAKSGSARPAGWLTVEH